MPTKVGGYLGTQILDHHPRGIDHRIHCHHKVWDIGVRFEGDIFPELLKLCRESLALGAEQVELADGDVDAGYHAGEDLVRGQDRGGKGGW